MLRIHRLQSPVTVLGPFSRAVIWVQGCDIGCPFCLAPYAQDPTGGTSIDVKEVAEWILCQQGVEGITLSGGEPTLQSEELVGLIDLVREQRPLGIVCYTGQTIERLQVSSNNSISALLDRVDLLIDGAYVRNRHADLLWRGSSNQRLIALTERYRSIVSSLTPETDRSAGIEFTASGRILYYAGVPAEPDFEKEIEREITVRHFLG